MCAILYSYKLSKSGKTWTAKMHYGLDLKFLPDVHMLKTWSPDCRAFGGGRVFRVVGA